jgi:hypothetical protein
MLSNWTSSLHRLLSAGIFSEGGPEVVEVPTLPDGLALLLMIILVTVLVLALYWNARSYVLPEGIGGHASDHGEDHPAEGGH